MLSWVFYTSWVVCPAALFYLRVGAFVNADLRVLRELGGLGLESTPGLLAPAAQYFANLDHHAADVFVLFHRDELHVMAEAHV